MISWHFAKKKLIKWSKRITIYEIQMKKCYLNNSNVVDIKLKLKSHTHTDRTRRKYVQKFNFVVEQLVQLEKFECEKQKERFNE